MGVAKERSFSVQRMGSTSSQIAVAVKLLGAILLLGVTAFCGFGFLASYEFEFPNVWHFLYCAVGAAALMAAVWLVLPGFKGLMTGAAGPGWTSHWRFFRLAALFSLFMVIAFLIGHVVHLALLSF
jgi:hypothetical protein